MSRVIKFRVWNVNGNCMHQWPELVEKNKIHLLSNQQAAYPVMQFTGLHDVNGQEVFEGDIVECEEHYYYEISWSEKHHCWYASDCGGLDDLPSSIKVIGNIYQNTELLK